MGDVLERKYLVPIVTAALFVAGIVLQLKTQGWPALIGWFIYGVAVCLIIIQILSMYSECSTPGGRQSKIGQPHEPRNPPDPPRRI